MKNYFIICLCVILISGCVTKPVLLDNNFDGWTTHPYKIHTADQTFTMFADRKLTYRYDPKNYVVTVKTEGEAAYNGKGCDPTVAGVRCFSETLYSWFYPNLCNQLFGTSVKTQHNSTYRTYNFLVDWLFYPQITSATCYSPGEQENQIKQAKLEKEKREKQQEERAIQAQLRVLEGKKEKCREYGFKDDTDGMGLCLIELDKLAVIEQQKNLQIQQQAIKNEAIARQQADAQRQRESQALINLGNMLMNMGTPAPINNRNEETKGMDKICYYETATGKKALTVSAVDICPLSYPY
jgi:hypothetical protein